LCINEKAGAEKENIFLYMCFSAKTIDMLDTKLYASADVQAMGPWGHGAMGPWGLFCGSAATPFTDFCLNYK
jgi:hypothetical protein